MRRIQAKGASAAHLREALKDIQGAQVREEAAGVFVEHGDEVDGARVDVAVRRAVGRSLIDELEAHKGADTPKWRETAVRAFRELMGMT